MGVKRFATLNDGTFFSPLNSRKKNTAKLRKAKQAFSRKCKRSNNCKKAKARVGRIENRIANARKDYLHKLSTQLCKTHAAICVEDLKVKNLSRSAKGSVEKPGRNVKAKSKLNHAILDQGWGEFRRQLAYKTEWNGGTFVAVPPANTSRLAAPSGRRVSGQRKGRRSSAVPRASGLGGHPKLTACHPRQGALNVPNRIRSKRPAPDSLVDVSLSAIRSWRQQVSTAKRSRRRIQSA